MKNRDILLKDLVGKDETKACSAAVYLVDNADEELFKNLIDKTDFLFPFVRNNVLKRITKAVNKKNYINLVKFFKYYSPYYDDLIVSILAEHANEELTDKILDILEKGTNEQKTYAAKYFSYIPDTVAIELLSKYAFSDDEDLSANSAEALGQMRDDVSFDIALNNINSDDSFEKLKAVKFFIAYGKNYPFKEIFLAMKTSDMPENIAGQIPYAQSLITLLDSEYRQDTLTCIYYIILGLGEILPIGDLFQFELYDVISSLISKEDNLYKSLIAVILLNALSKFKMFCENEEYVFDEDKNTKNEISSILNLLEHQSNEFWDKQKNNVLPLLKGDKKDILAVLPVIKEYSIIKSIDELINLTESNDEVVIYETLNTLKSLNAINKVDVNSIINKIQNPNIKALIENI